MTGILTILNIGNDIEFVNLYSDVDNFTSAFAINIETSQLLIGLVLNNVPNNTKIIRVRAVGVCNSFLDVILDSNFSVISVIYNGRSCCTNP